MLPKMNIIVPLYIYPSPGAWDGLLRSISTYPTVKFIIVVNPHNGPGVSLDDNYSRDIRELNSHPNAVVVGYVSTAYATRQYSAVLEDVLTYARWRLDGNELGIRGIFFDETPNQWTSANASFLRSINSLVKGNSGFGVERLTIHNPGTVPHWRLMRGPCLPDIAVVFEASHQTYIEQRCEEALSKLEVVPERLACIMHSVPDSLMTASSDVASQIKQLEPLVGTVYITSQTSNLYTSLGEHWDQFIQAINLCDEKDFRGEP